MNKEIEAMKLPAGKKCDDCYAFRFCNGIGCTWSGRTECDYYPRRFAEPATSNVQPETLQKS